MSAAAIDPNQIGLALAEAERELFAWAIGQRSFMNEMMSNERWYDDGSGQPASDRQLTFVRIAERDAAELRIAREKVLALRLLISGELNA